MTDRPLLLLAEDEPIIRLALHHALEEGGFAVLVGINGNEAIAAVEAQYLDLAGLITDIRLGAGPSGWEIARRARELNPAIGVVYITGDSMADWPASGVPKSFVLEKPFADAQMITAISTLLNEPG